MQIHAYQVLSCPRYEDLDHDQPKMQENILSQVTLLNALRYLASISQSSVELRFVSDPMMRGVHPFLIVYSSPHFAPDSLVFERLLPLEYQWQKIAVNSLEDVPEPPCRPGDHRYVSHLQRRLEVVDLPGSWSQLYPDQGSLLPGNPVDPSRDASIDLISGMQNGRTLPPLLPLGPRQRQQAHEVSQLCIPLLAPLCDASPDRRRFCREMQHAAPGVLSIALHPVREDELGASKMVAGVLRSWLHPFLSQLRNSGFATAADIASTYDRFAAPANNLWRMSIRVASLSAPVTMSLAHAFCANLGGARVFDITTPVATDQPLCRLGRPPEPASGTVHKQLSDMQITDVEPEYVDFLQNLPHVFDLEEAATVTRLPYGFKEGLPGLDTRLTVPFHPVNQPRMVLHETMQPGTIRLGMTHLIAGGTAPPDWRCLPLQDLTKHTLIVGSTGSGKSVTTEFLLRELDRNDVPFLVIEPVKTEYRDALEGMSPGLKHPLNYYGLEGEANGLPGANFLIFDPMRLQPGVSVARHVSYLKSCFNAAFPLSDVLALILENGLYAYYLDPPAQGGCGFRPLSRGGKKKFSIRRDKNGNPHVFPSFETFSNHFLHRYLPRSLGQKGHTEFSRDAMEAFTRRFDNLSQGPLGLAFKRADRFARESKTLNSVAWNPFELLLRGHAVLELDALPDNEEKSLAMAFLLTFLFERRQSEDLLRRERRRRGQPVPDLPPLRHMLVVEEAHRLLAAGNSSRSAETVGESASEKSVSLFVDMLAEIRAYRQGITIVEQIPTKIVPEAIKNTNLKMMMRLTAEDDRDFLGEAMNFDEEQKRFVMHLRTGQCVAFAENLETPVMLSVPSPESWTNLFA